MKNFLKTFRVIIPAGEEASALAATGDNLAVYETNAPFIVRDDSGSLYEIDRACRVESLEKDGFGRLTLLRPPGVTGDIVVKLAVGSGVRLFDGRLQYTSQTTNAPVFNIATLENKPLPRFPVRSRFLPRFDGKCPLVGDPVFSADTTKGPFIKQSRAAAFNMLAPANDDVVRRVIRLTSGASAKIGRNPDALGGTGTAGQFFELTAANPERVLAGSEALFGYSAEDCDVTVFEEHETAGAAALPAIIPASIAAPGVAVNPPRTLWGFIAFSFVGVLPFSDENGRLMGGLIDSADWPAVYSGNVAYYKGGWKNADGSPHVSGSSVSINGINRIVFDGIPPAAATAGLPTGEYASGVIRQNFSYVTFEMMSQSPGGRVMFSTGQSFAVSTYAQIMAADGRARNLFRIAFPWDGGAPIVEQCDKPRNYSGTTGATPWLLNS